MESFQFFLIKNISRRENSHSGLYIPQGISLQPCTHPVNKGFFRCRCGDTGATLEIPLGSVGLRYNEKHYRFFLIEEAGEIQSLYFAPENISANQLLTSIQGKVNLKPCWPCIKIDFTPNGLSFDLIFTNQISPLF